MLGLSAALGLGSTVAGLANKPAVPEPEVPAGPAAPAKDPGAVVRVGADNKKVTNDTTEFKGFVEKRKSGQALGGLGRGGLTI